MRKFLLYTLILALLMPLFFVGYCYLRAMATGLPGRKGGPQDAFRHAYASAVVSRYISPKVVVFVTLKMENDDNSPFDRMDRHNNIVGIQIAESGFSIYESIDYLILRGGPENTSQEELVWLDEKDWSDGF